MNQPKQNKENCCMGGCGNINCNHCSEPPKEKCNALIQATVAGNIICSNDKPCFFHLAELPKRAVYEDRSQDPPKENSMQISKDALAKKGWEKEFEKTKFAIGGGSSFECSDFEGMYVELKQFISSLLVKEKQICQDAIRNYCDDHTECRKAIEEAEKRGYEAGQIQQMNRKIYQGILEDAREEERKRVLDVLNGYVQHDGDCILSQYEEGEPTKDGGYRTKFVGKWYKEKPKCNCGLDDIWEQLKFLTEELK